MQEQQEKQITSEQTGASERCATGCPGLDEVLGGGLPRGHFYLLEGEPGAGKTTLALQFVLEGIRQGESILYVTMSESRRDLLSVARSHGFPLEGINIFELMPAEEDLGPDGQYTVFHPAEVELNDRTQTILSEVKRLRPARLVIDALSELRMLAKDPLRYRRQILSLKEAIGEFNCTVVLLDDKTSHQEHLELHSIVHGVISLQKIAREYGNSRRRVEVTKLRGCAFREGYHDFLIKTGGVVVYPRLVAAEYRTHATRGTVPSGIPEIDELTGGGLDRGTATLFMGPAGCGKTTIAMRWALSAAQQGDSAAAFMFEESLGTLMMRASGLGMDLNPYIKSGRLRIEPVDPAELAPGEFVEKIRGYVEKEDVRTILIDSLNGFMHSMPGEDFLAIHLHELLAYLNNRGVLTLLVLAQAGIGVGLHGPVDVSYLADNILVLRYFEAAGEVRQAISMMKKRSGGHEHTIRELKLGPERIRVGKPLTDFQGVLTGIPLLLGQNGKSA